jgi:hypothetical protein
MGLAMVPTLNVEGGVGCQPISIGVLLELVDADKRQNSLGNEVRDAASRKLLLLESQQVPERQATQLSCRVDAVFIEVNWQLCAELLPNRHEKLVMHCVLAVQEYEDDQALGAPGLDAGFHQYSPSSAR